MLNYFKIILEKVSFDKFLFEKELKKALNSLMPKEVAILWSWCNLKFGYKYLTIIDRCFSRFSSKLAV